MWKVRRYHSDDASSTYLESNIFAPKIKIWQGGGVLAAKFHKLMMVLRAMRLTEMYGIEIRDGLFESDILVKKMMLNEKLLSINI